MKCKKVFCKNCKHYKKYYNMGSLHNPRPNGCMHPDNIKQVKCWYENSDKPKIPAYKLNKNNTCVWYDEI